jgi:hypothetical protein
MPKTSFRKNSDSPEALDFYASIVFKFCCAPSRNAAIRAGHLTSPAVILAASTNLFVQNITDPAHYRPGIVEISQFLIIQLTWVSAMSGGCSGVIPEVTMAWMPHSNQHRCIHDVIWNKV